MMSGVFRKEFLVSRTVTNKIRVEFYSKKGQLLFVFNFHPSYEQELQLQFPEKPELIFDSDDQKFGGFGPRSSFGWSKGHLNLILEPRTAMVFQIKE